ncbi:hypothetical protein [Lentzea sp. NPDC051838]|uniref:hypothetical protein n=1 Tax=Lentzea sp. NPDC051838 TaxID=3154849 RepID=UPI003420742C
MTFAREARRVRDESLPMSTRVIGLRACLQHYKPIGFDASFSFLESLVGNLRKDPAALLLALDLLTASHAAWQAELHAYGLLRRRAKLLGYRVPHPSAPNPNRPSHWYGARREAAFHAVWFWYSKGASDDVDVHALAAALVHRGRFTAVQREMLLEVRPNSWDSKVVLQQMAVVAGEAR